MKRSVLPRSSSNVRTGVSQASSCARSADRSSVRASTARTRTSRRAVHRRLIAGYSVAGSASFHSLPRLAANHAGVLGSSADTRVPRRSSIANPLESRRDCHQSPPPPPHELPLPPHDDSPLPPLGLGSGADVTALTISRVCRVLSSPALGVEQVCVGESSRRTLRAVLPLRFVPGTCARTGALTMTVRWGP